MCRCLLVFGVIIMCWIEIVVLEVISLKKVRLMLISWLCSGLFVLVMNNVLGSILMYFDCIVLENSVFLLLKWLYIVSFEMLV